MKDWLEIGQQREREGDEDGAVEAYEHAIQEGKTLALPYDRLMILYRKNKNYAKELKVIRAGIRAFEKLHRETSKTRMTKKISELSKAFSLSSGLMDREGQALYQIEPIGRWKKREEVVGKRMKKQ